MKRKNGFTLVEILMTISLLSLVIIIVVPSAITISNLCLMEIEWLSNK